MSCEVFCCEIGEILHVLVESAGGKHLVLLFSFLELEPPLDHHLAGYFEKVSELLFRRMTVPVMRYVNTGGIRILESFLRHMDSYSIMQIVQRLMLPHIPFSINSDPESLHPNESQNYQCNWSYSEETCALLCARMLEIGNVDVPSHISDLLITVLQLSPADALILSHLCQKQCVESIIAAAIVDDTDTATPGGIPTPVQCVGLAAISVLESMVLRLGETAGPFSDEAVQRDASVSAELQQIKESVENFLSALLPYLPKINEQLQAYATSEPCGTITGQTKRIYPRLGHRGLQLVKFVESLVRLTNVAFDAHLCSSGVLASATELVFCFELNSILHLSIQRVVLMIIEGGPARRLIQRHILVECGLLKRIMDRIDQQMQLTPPVAVDGETSVVAVTRSPSLGHLIHIVQALHHNLQNETFEAGVRQDEEDLMGKAPVVAEMAAEVGSGTNASGGVGADQTVSDNKIPSLQSVIESGGLLDEWQLFVQSLVQNLESQASFAGEVSILAFSFNPLRSSLVLSLFVPLHLTFLYFLHY